MTETLARVMLPMEPHERQILRLAMDGRDNKAIAREVEYSVRTVQRVLDSAEVRLRKILADSQAGGD